MPLVARRIFWWRLWLATPLLTRIFYTPKFLRILFTCLPLIVSTPAKPRLRLALFFSRKWFPEARLRKNLPVLVTLTRFFVPLWVFSFGMDLRTPYNKVQLPACKLGLLVNSSTIAQLLNDPLS
jgi:hypothetical protein